MMLRFACGHATSCPEDVQQAPTCWCGEHRIARVFVRVPRFRGVAQGPHVVSEALTGLPVSAAPSGPLVMKGSDDGRG